MAAVAVANTDVVSWPPRMPVADEKDSAAGDCGTDLLPAEAAELETVVAALPCKMELRERTEELEMRLDLVCCCAFRERNCGVEAPVVWDGGVASGLVLKLAGADSLSWRSWPVGSRKLRAAGAHRQPISVEIVDAQTFEGQTHRRRWHGYACPLRHFLASVQFTLVSLGSHNDGGRRRR